MLLFAALERTSLPGVWVATSPGSRLGIAFLLVLTTSTPWRHNLHKRFNECLARARIRKNTPDGVADIHALRVSYGTNLVEAGADIRTVQRLMRHKDPSVTMRFHVKVRHENLRRAVEAVAPILPPASGSRALGGAAEQGQSGNKAETCTAKSPKATKT